MVEYLLLLIHRGVDMKEYVLDYMVVPIPENDDSTDVNRKSGMEKAFDELNAFYKEKGISVDRTINVLRQNDMLIAIYKREV